MNTDTLLAAVKKNGVPLSYFHKGYIVRGAGKMSLKKGYSYRLDAEPGQDFDPRFTPALSPAEMLFMGVFEGKYLNDSYTEFPSEWYLYALAANRLSPSADISCNWFNVKSRQPLSVWRENGWAPVLGFQNKGGKGKTRDILADVDANPDERGWFQWYCRYWLGRRIPDLDAVQIGRWRSFARHAGAIRHGCSAGDLMCRTRERQALLQWAYDPFI